MLALYRSLRDTVIGDIGVHDQMSAATFSATFLRRRSAWPKLFALIVAIGAAAIPCQNGWAQSFPSAPAAPTPAIAPEIMATALDLTPSHLVPLYHMLSGTPVPAGTDAAMVQSLTTIGVEALRDLPYRFRIPVLLGAGADGLVLEPVLGAPGLQVALEAQSYELRVAIAALSSSGTTGGCR